MVLRPTAGLALSTWCYVLLLVWPYPHGVPSYCWFGLIHMVFRPTAGLALSTGSYVLLGPNLYVQLIPSALPTCLPYVYNRS